LRRKPARAAGPRRPGSEAFDEVLSRVFVDSGGFIALFSSADRHHDTADALFRACVRRGRLITTQLVVAEVHRFLLFNAGIAAATTAIKKISTSPALVIECTTAAHHRAACEWLAKLDDQVISYTDATSFAVMTATRCTVALSFDNDFTIAGFTVLQLGML
jgi:predicted nucleic acid-binding protein